MKLTKKAAALLLAASLAVSVCATPVFADDTGTTTTPPLNMGSHEVSGQLVGNSLSASWNTKVLYKVTEHYTWSVPTTIDFGVNAGVDNTSTVDANLDGDKDGKKAEKDSTGTTWKGTAPKVCVKENVIGVGKNLQITVDTKGASIATFKNNKFYVVASGTSGTSEELYFTITKPAKGSANETVLGTANNEVIRVPSGTNTADQELVFKLETAANTAGNAAEKAGDYEGHVVFFSQLV